MGIFTECPKCEEKNAEIERLRERLDAGLNVRDKEIERLRGVLREWLCSEWRDIDVHGLQYRPSDKLVYRTREALGSD